MNTPIDPTIFGDLMGDFLDEAAEHLKTLETGLLRLEEDEDPESELVGELFRAMHSLKGAAGFLDLVQVVEISHVAENLLSQIRDGNIAPTSDAVDALLSACDLLRGLLANSHEGDSDDIRETVARLQQVMNGSSSVAASEKAQKKIDAPKTIFVKQQLADTPVASDHPSIAWPIVPLPEEYRALHEEEFLYIVHCESAELKKNGVDDVAEWLSDLSGTALIVAIHYNGEWFAFDLDIWGGGPLDVFDFVLSTALEKDMVAVATLIDEMRIRDITLPDTEKELLATVSSSAVAGADAISPAGNSRGIQPKASVEAFAATPEIAASGRTVRISVDLMDTIMALAGELVLIRNQQLSLVDRADTRLRDNAQRLDMVTSQLQESIMLTRMQPIGNLFDKFTRIVRDLGRRLDKEIQLEISGRDVEIDKIILENLSDPMTHLIRNSCDHGIESPEKRIEAGKPTTGMIGVNAFQEGGQIIIEIRDDGQGIDPERIKRKAHEQGMHTLHELERMKEAQILKLILEPGFSTVDQVSEISGRGVGMDVVKSCIESLGGTIEITSKPGLGTRILLRLPLTLAIIPSLIVRSEGEPFAIPQVSLEELVSIKPDGSRGRIEVAHQQEVFRLRDRLLPVVRLRELLDHSDIFGDNIRRGIVKKYATQRAGEHEKSINLAIVKTGNDRYGLIVDEILGTEEIVVKPLHPSLKRMPCFSGCTIMGDGRVALILDIDGITSHADLQFTRLHADGIIEKSHKEYGTDDTIEESHDIFLFQYGPDEQFAVPLTMMQRIETISSSEIQRVGDREFVSRDGVSTYVLRLDRMLGVSSPEKQPEIMHLIMSKYIRRPVGILVTSIVDTVEAHIAFREDSYLEDGLLGSMTLNGKITLFLDIFRLVEKAEPEWFGQRKMPLSGQMHRRVLLVEDAEFFRHVVRRYLEDGGFEVVTAVNGRDALMHLNEEEFDIVVSDLVMPEMDGWSLAEEIRRRARKRKVPLLALSALQDENDRRKAFQSGFDRYVPKFDREAFLNNVLELLANNYSSPPPTPMLEHTISSGERQ